MNDKGKKYQFSILTKEECQTFSEKDVLDNNTVYIDEEWIWLKCPCGCGEIYKLNTTHQIKPKWTFVTPNSIRPSINHTAGCRSHFTITNGITG